MRMIRMGMAIKLIEAVAKMGKFSVFSADNGFIININNDDDINMDATAVNTETGESFRFKFKKRDRDNYQYIIANEKKIALLIVAEKAEAE